MSFKYHIDRPRRVTTVRFKDSVTPHDIHHCFARLQSDPKWESSRFVFFDFSRVRKIQTGPPPGERQKKTLSSAWEILGDRKIAVAISRDQETALAQVLPVLAGRVSPDHGTFRNPWSAWDWLEVPDPWGSSQHHLLG